MTRAPAVAGQFYPGDRRSLLRELEGMVPEVSNKIDAVGAVSPHAGYIYSGPVAGEVYAKLKPRDTYIILSPNHTGYGGRFASSREAWKTPLGEVEVNIRLLDAVMAGTDLVTEDPRAHAFEHSIEVQLPFIQKTSPHAKIVPVTVQSGSFEELEEVAGAIASAVKGVKESVTIISSSDMTHYEHRKRAQEKDKLAIQAVLDLDARGLLRVVENKNISMCGYIPTAIMIMAAKELGAKKGELIRYTDSGEASGDIEQVVGYAGIIVY